MIPEVTIRTENGKFVLAEDYEYAGVKCEKGMLIDGASVPTIWTMFVPRMKASYLASTVIHDKLCEEERYKEADRLFYKMLYKQNVKKWRRKVMYAAVRLWHKYKYGK